MSQLNENILLQNRVDDSAFVQATHVETTHVQGISVETTPVETTHVETTSVETTPVETTHVQASHIDESSSNVIDNNIDQILSTNDTSIVIDNNMASSDDDDDDDTSAIENVDEPMMPTIVSVSSNVQTGYDDNGNAKEGADMVAFVESTRIPFTLALDRMKKNLNDLMQVFVEYDEMTWNYLTASINDLKPKNDWPSRLICDRYISIPSIPSTTTPKASKTTKSVRPQVVSVSSTPKVNSNPFLVTYRNKIVSTVPVPVFKPQPGTKNQKKHAYQIQCTLLKHGMAVDVSDSTCGKTISAVMACAPTQRVIVVGGQRAIWDAMLELGNRNYASTKVPSTTTLSHMSWTRNSVAHNYLDLATITRIMPTSFRSTILYDEIVQSVANNACILRGQTSSKGRKRPAPSSTKGMIRVKKQRRNPSLSAGGVGTKGDRLSEDSDSDEEKAAPMAARVDPYASDSASDDASKPVALAPIAKSGKELKREKERIRHKDETDNDYAVRMATMRKRLADATARDSANRTIRRQLKKAQDANDKVVSKSTKKTKQVSGDDSDAPKRKAKVKKDSNSDDSDAAPASKKKAKKASDASGCDASDVDRSGSMKKKKRVTKIGVSLVLDDLLLRVDDVTRGMVTFYATSLLDGLLAHTDGTVLIFDHAHQSLKGDENTSIASCLARAVRASNMRQVHSNLMSGVNKWNEFSQTRESLVTVAMKSDSDDITVGSVIPGDIQRTYVDALTKLAGFRNSLLVISSSLADTKQSLSHILSVLGLDTDLSVDVPSDILLPRTFFRTDLGTTRTWPTLRKPFDDTIALWKKNETENDSSVSTYLTRYVTACTESMENKTDARNVLKLTPSGLSLLSYAGVGYTKEKLAKFTKITESKIKKDITEKQINLLTLIYTKLLQPKLRCCMKAEIEDEPSYKQHVQSLFAAFGDTDVNADAHTAAYIHACRTNDDTNVMDGPNKFFTDLKDIIKDDHDYSKNGTMYLLNSAQKYAKRTPAVIKKEIELAKAPLFFRLAIDLLVHKTTCKVIVVVQENETAIAIIKQFIDTDIVPLFLLDDKSYRSVADLTAQRSRKVRDMKSTSTTDASVPIADNSTTIDPINFIISSVKDLDIQSNFQMPTTDNNWRHRILITTYDSHYFDTIDLHDTIGNYPRYTLASPLYHTTGVYATNMHGRTNRRGVLSDSYISYVYGRIDTYLDENRYIRIETPKFSAVPYAHKKDVSRNLLDACPEIQHMAANEFDSINQLAVMRSVTDTSAPLFVDNPDSIVSSTINLSHALPAGIINCGVMEMTLEQFNNLGPYWNGGSNKDRLEKPANGEIIHSTSRPSVAFTMNVADALKRIVADESLEKSARRVGELRSYIGSFIEMKNPRDDAKNFSNSFRGKMNRAAIEIGKGDVNAKTDIEKLISANKANDEMNEKFDKREALLDKANAELRVALQLRSRQDSYQINRNPPRYIEFNDAFAGHGKYRKTGIILHAFESILRKRLIIDRSHNGDNMSSVLSDGEETVTRNLRELWMQQSTDDLMLRFVVNRCKMWKYPMDVPKMIQDALDRDLELAIDTDARRAAGNASAEADDVIDST